MIANQVEGEFETHATMLRCYDGRMGRIQLPRTEKGDGKLHLSSLILRGGFESAVCFEIACDLMTVRRSSVGSYSYSCMR